MLCFRLGRLEWTREDRQFDVFEFAWHLRMRERLVDEHAGIKSRILEAAARLLHDLDEVEVYVAPLLVDNREHRLDDYLGQLALAILDTKATNCARVCRSARSHFGAERC